MPGPHPRRRHVRDDVQLTHVRDWAPPGWHWEVLPGGARRLVRNPTSGPVVDPDLIWWRSRGPHVRRRIREEDEHVHRYMAAMDDVRFSTTWRVLWADDRRYDPVMVPSLWVCTARARGTASGALDSSVVLDLY